MMFATSGAREPTTAARLQSVFPDAMRWLWRDWPAPIRAREPGNPVLKAILQPGEDWQVAGESCVSGLASNPQGQIRCGQPQRLPLEPTAGSIKPVPGGGVKVTGRASILGEGLDIRNLTVRNNGDIYAADAEANYGSSERREKR